MFRNTKQMDSAAKHRLPPPGQVPTHSGVLHAQDKPSLVGDCYGVRVRTAGNGHSDKSQGQGQFSSFATQAVTLHSVSWVPLRWDLDHPGQSYRREQGNCTLGKARLKNLASAQLPQRGHAIGSQSSRKICQFFILYNNCGCKNKKQKTTTPLSPPPKQKHLIKQKKQTNEPLQIGLGPDNSWLCRAVLCMQGV